jgi:hypothetical protein
VLYVLCLASILKTCRLTLFLKIVAILSRMVALQHLLVIVPWFATETALSFVVAPTALMYTISPAAAIRQLAPGL